MPIQKPPTNVGHLGQGIAYPLAYNSAGRLVLSWGAAAVEDAMESIVRTVAGERVMQPDYGGAVGLHEPVRDPGLMAEAIKDTVREHEPRVAADEVDVLIGNVDASGRVEMTVRYRIVGEATERTLTYPFFAGPTSG